MNAVRKHVSWIKGGRLAEAAHPARVLSLVVSDIPGDDPALVASGPTIPDPTGRAAALSVVRRRGMKLPEAVQAHLERGECEAPHPGAPAFRRDEVRVIASAGLSLEAAAAAARARGIDDALRVAEALPEKPRLTLPLNRDGVKMDWVWIPPGSFRMGSEQGFADERPPRERQVAQGFWMTRTEVTQSQFRA